MTNEELNRAAAEAIGWTFRGATKEPREGWTWQDVWVTPSGGLVPAPNWSPATKIEDAWIVQQAACGRSSDAFVLALMKLGTPDGNGEYHTWLATAPPRARVEAAMQVLNGGES